MSEPTDASKHEPAEVPVIDTWVAAPPPVVRPSKWDTVVDQVRAGPPGEWARLERPDPWNSSFPGWFRKKYPDMELSVPTLYNRPPKPHYMYMRAKPEQRSKNAGPPTKD